MRIIQPYPPEITEFLFRLGDRSLVWVEGTDDEETFREWFAERRDEIEFYAAGGWRNVEHKLQEYLNYVQCVFGIVDRDFRSDADVTAMLEDPAARLFVLRRYAIENYLLEPVALCEELRVYYGSAHPVPNVAEVEAHLLQLCRQLRTMMAANWVFFELGLPEGERYFQPTHQLQERDALIEQAARRADCKASNIEAHIAAKEASLTPLLDNLSDAHTCINGKHLLHQFYFVYVIGVRRGLHKDHFRRLLARAVKQQGLPSDIILIVEQRILQCT